MVRASKPASVPISSTLLAVALAIAGLYFGRQIFIPLALALVLSFLFSPFVGLLEKCRLGRAPSVIIVLAFCFAVTGAVSWSVANQLLEITANFRDYKDNLDDKIRALHAPKGGTLGQATATVRELNKELAAAPQQARDSAANRASQPAHPIPVQVTAPPTSLAQDLRALFGPLSGPLETSSVVVIFMAFMLIQREDLRNRLIRLGGEGQLNVMTQALDEASRRLSRYLLLQFLINASYGVLFGLGLYLLSIPHAMLWGTLAALLRFVPYIGTLIAASLPVAIATAVFPGWGHAVFAFGLFVVLELIIANAIEPWLYGAHTGISSFAILVAAVFWTMLWGPVGLILSTPLTVCLMLIGRYVPQLSFFEVLLGDAPVLSPQEIFYQRLLAMDQDEARRIAEAHLQEHPLESLYESVLIPAMRLAEEDRHMDALGERASEFIYQGTRELIEDLGDRLTKQEQEDSEKAPDDIVKVRSSPATLVCVPARDEADELVGMMLSQLLRKVGTAATYLPISTVNEMLDRVEQGKFRIVCVSALPPFAVGQARSLCKRLRSRFPDISIVVGLWSFAGGVPRAQDRIGTGCTDAVVTTLVEALLQIRRLGEPSSTQAIELDAARAVNLPSAATQGAND